MKKKPWQVIGRTFCHMHLETSNQIFHCRANYVATGCLLVWGETLVVRHFPLASCVVPQRPSKKRENLPKLVNSKAKCLFHWEKPSESFFVPFFNVKMPSSWDQAAATAESTQISLAAAGARLAVASSLHGILQQSQLRGGWSVIENQDALKAGKMDERDFQTEICSSSHAPLCKTFILQFLRNIRNLVNHFWIYLLLQTATHQIETDDSKVVFSFDIVRPDLLRSG